MEKQLIFSVGLKDCTVQTFRAGGKGGQHQNKTETGVRIIHNASGAVGECRDERSQFSNKKMAFLRMAESEKFKKWHRIETARRFGYSPKEELRKDFTPTNIKVESKANNKWEIDENLAVTQNEINGIIDEVTQ